MTTPLGWAPTVDAVGALLRARTKDTNGRELGTFTPATRPTELQVIELRDQAVADLADVIHSDDPNNPTPIPPRLYGSASRVAALETAMAIELGYYPEQVATGRSPYAQLKELRDERLSAFLRALEDAGHDTDADTGGGDSGVPAAPTGGFPAPTVFYLETPRTPGAEVGHTYPLAW